MLFNSLVFMFVFLPITYGAFWLLRTTHQRHVLLTLAGYIFYGYWDPRFCLLMAFSTLVSYCAGLAFLRWTDPKQRRVILICPITLDLLLLGFFKYAGFAARTVNDVAGVFHAAPLLPVLNV